MQPQTKTFIFCVLIAALVVVLFWRECGRPEMIVPVTADSSVFYRSKVSDLKHELAIRKPEIQVKEVQVVKWQKRWKTSRHDSLIPCDSLVVICDSTIVADSSLIAVQKVQLATADSLISSLETLRRIDSTRFIVVIDSLKKEVRKQKKRKWIAIGAAAVLAGLHLK